MPTEPWWSYPPEINAARIMGVGPGPWIAASQAWAIMAGQIQAAQTIFTTQNVLQADVIGGRTSDAVSASIGPFGSWLEAMHAEAARNALDTQNVSTSYMSAVTSTVPLPVVQANRAAAAAAYSSNLFGIPNPAGPILDAQYAGMQVQNGTAMTAYDTSINGFTAPRTYQPAPRLVSEAGGLTPAGPNVNIAEMGQNMLNSIMGDQAPTLDALGQQFQAAAANPAVSQMMSQTAATAPGTLANAGQAMMPVRSVMGQMATPVGGVLGNGLGHGGYPLGATGAAGNAARGGLPLGMAGMGGGLSGTTGGGRAMGMGGTGALGAAGASSSMASARPVGALGGLGGLGAGAGAGSGAAKMAGFRGIPLDEGHRGPLGGAPVGAQHRRNDNKTADEMTVEDVQFSDPVREAQQRAEQMRKFK